MARNETKVELRFPRGVRKGASPGRTATPRWPESTRAAPGGSCRRTRSRPA